MFPPPMVRARTLRAASLLLALALPCAGQGAMGKRASFSVHANRPCIDIVDPVDYTPKPDVVQSYEAQRLTVFYPSGPAPVGGWPTLLYSPCGGFTQTEPNGAPLPGEGPGAGGVGIETTAGFVENLPLDATDVGNNTFLTEAIARGWAVVSVGSVGINSCGLPYPPCTDLGGCPGDPECCAGPPGACRDPNLYYSPDSPEWQDPSIFYGEKDFTWARQYVAHHARPGGDGDPSNDPDLCIDNDRVVAVGVSCGALYAAFLALGPNRAFENGISPQLAEDTRVAGLIAFEAPTWWPAYWSYLFAFHWPRANDPLVRATTLGPGPPNPGATSPAESDLRESSMSWQIRQIPSQDPAERSFAKCFLAYKDPFGMCESLPPGWGYYNRTPGTNPALQRVDLLGQGWSLHDPWSGIAAKQDLLWVDRQLGTQFYRDASRLFLGDQALVAEAAGCLPPLAPPHVTDVDGTVVSAFSYGWQWNGGQYPPSASCVSYQTPRGDHYCPIVDGAFRDQSGAEADKNTNLWGPLFCWMSTEFDVPYQNPAVGFRNAGTNPDVFRSEVPFVGEDFTMCLDLEGEPYSIAAFIGWDTPTEFVLGGGQVLLEIDAGSGPMLGDGELYPRLGDGIVVRFPVAPDPDLAGLHVYGQAILIGGAPYGLSNAQDLVVQMF